ncbi:uncharacterized protein [Typha latifolia]|uniref:uncharacterized protein n=1 Tax=Typha latifolia TaxID=4733 RepID=UPI003C305F51
MGYLSHRTIQYQKSGYTNRRAGSGTWYAEKKNPGIESESDRVIEYKQMLSFCLCGEDGDRPKRKRKKSTGWVMYEYELPAINASTRPCEESVLCLIKKSAQAISSSRKKQAATAANATFPSTSGYIGLPTSTLDSYAIADFANPACPSSDFDTTADFVNPPCLSITREECGTAYAIPMTPVPATPTSDTEAGKPVCRSSSASSWTAACRDRIRCHRLLRHRLNESVMSFHRDTARRRRPLDAVEFAEFLNSTLEDAGPLGIRRPRSSPMW